MIYNKMQNNLIMKFSYHEAIIVETKIEQNDLILILSDGWNEGQINEIRFINYKIDSKNDLNGREIYQILDLVSFAKNKYFMELLIWYYEVEGNIAEVVKIEAENIISKKYKDGKLEEEEDLMKKIYS